MPRGRQLGAGPRTRPVNRLTSKSAHVECRAAPRMPSHAQRPVCGWRPVQSAARAGFVVRTGGSCVLARRGPGQAQARAGQDQTQTIRRDAQEGRRAPSIRAAAQPPQRATWGPSNARHSPVHLALSESPTPAINAGCRDVRTEY
ncbi:hypothetical protein CERSUDRAFT_97366 [Gelatoporia subvermispora B]|uniref:Uncharacterized protein n=1 Tax=Ceriporiopsis subvermispora (strain B) TaxID=914234 RepID=M2R7V8_CERS8|nr:hypothetical protein CERSUDRAFT_97366 [Gelatoporia subvermispora B]